MLNAPAPAKLNLGLHVLRRRGDGFHDLDTVFVRIPWCDIVTVRSSEHLSMTCSDRSLPTDEDNVCMRAAKVLKSKAGVDAGASIHLEKHIPHGSGLGGGSSDAATTLMLLMRLWNVDPAAVDLAGIALEVGSDVPFFLGPPVARGQGRGERLTPLSMPLGLRDSVIVVAVPSTKVSTAWAFGLVRPSSADRDDICSILESRSAILWRGQLSNDFQQPISRSEPSILDALGTLEAGGADYRALSGSGSAVYGVFSDPDSADSARRHLDNLPCQTWSGRAGDPPDSLFQRGG